MIRELVKTKLPTEGSLSKALMAYAKRLGVFLMTVSLTTLTLEWVLVDALSQRERWLGLLIGAAAFILVAVIWRREIREDARELEYHHWASSHVNSMPDPKSHLKELGRRSRLASHYLKPVLTASITVLFTFGIIAGIMVGIGEVTSNLIFIVILLVFVGVTLSAIFIGVLASLPSALTDKEIAKRKKRSSRD